MEYFRYILSFVFVIGLILILALVGRLLFKRNQSSLASNFENRFFPNKKKSENFNIQKLLYLSGKAAFFEITWYNEIYLVYENLGKIEVIANMDIDKAKKVSKRNNQNKSDAMLSSKGRKAKEKDGKIDGNSNKSFLKVLLQSAKNN